MDRQHLLDVLGQRAAAPMRATDCSDVVKPERFPPVDVEQLAVAEKALGFRLPPLLADIYTHVGNGGFGPAYGLLGLPGGAEDDLRRDAVRLYLEFRRPDADDVHWKWPERLLPVGHLGCAMYACVDCSSDDGAIVWFEPNPHENGTPWDDSFIALAPSLHEWLVQWLEGVDMFARFADADDMGH